MNPNTEKQIEKSLSEELVGFYEPSFEAINR